MKYNIKKIAKAVISAIRGTEEDFTEGSLARAIFLLSVPMILEMLMESVFAVVDIFFVSKLGADAVAVVGITETMITIVYAVGVGLSVAATAVISRRIGEKKYDEANNSAFQAILTGLVPGILISLIGIIYAEELLLLMGLNAKLAQDFHIYTAIIISSNLIIMLLFIINGIFRSAGDAAVAMKVLFIANMLNIVLDPLLIFGFGPIPAFGIAGAAVATTIGRGIAVIYQFYLLFKGNGRIKIDYKRLKIDVPIILKILKLSAGTIGQYLIATASWIGLLRILAEFGSTVLAGYTIAIRVMIFVLLPAFGLGNAASTLVGQNLGAGKPERAERAVWATGLLSMGLLGVISLVFILTPEFWIKVFITDPEIVEIGGKALQILSIGFIFYGLGMIIVHAINGAGDTFTPTVINLLCFWLFEIPFAYITAITLGIGESGVFWAIVTAETLMTIIAWAVFRRGKWKTRAV